MRKRLAATVVSALLMAMSATPSFAATTGYRCSAAVTVSGAVNYHNTVNFEAKADLTNTHTVTYKVFGLVYNVTVAVSCRPGT